MSFLSKFRSYRSMEPTRPTSPDGDTNNNSINNISSNRQAIPLSVIPSPPSPMEESTQDFVYNDGNDNDYDNDYDDNNNNHNNHNINYDYNGSSMGGKKMLMRQTHEGEYEDDFVGVGSTSRISGWVYFYAFCAALNSCNLGYDIGANTNAGPLLQEAMELTDVQIEIFMGSLNLFAMVGALSAQYISDQYGRKGGFMIAAVSFILGVVVLTLSATYVSLMCGRILIGLGVGFGLAIDPIYIAEISPAAHRGFLVTWSEIATNVGIVFGFASGYFFRGLDADAAWRGIFGLGIILPCVMIVLLLTAMPESPRWLVQMNRTDEAIRVLTKVYGPGFDVMRVITNIQQGIAKEEEAADAVGWDVILFPSLAYRRMLLVGLGTAISQQIVGIDAIQYFLVYILDEAGIESRDSQTAILIFLGIVKLGFIVVAGNIFDRRGRRPMFFISLSGMTASLLILSFCFYVNLHYAWVSIIALAMYMSFFSLAMGPGCWLIPSEIFTLTIRAKAMALATFLNRCTGTIMSSTFLSIAHAMTWPGFFLGLAVVCGLVGLFFFIYLPETKGRALEDMAVYFAELTGDRTILDVELQRNQPHSPLQPGENEEEEDGGRILT